MIKKILLFSLISSYAFSYCYCYYSSSTEDNVHGAFQELDQEIEQQNDKIEDKYKDKIKPLVDEIKQISQKNENLIKIIRELEKEKLLVSKNKLFLLEKEMQLLNTQSDLESSKREK